MFQHTAARRRLALSVRNENEKYRSFNTQPPEGGWLHSRRINRADFPFQHTAARRRLVVGMLDQAGLSGVSTHSRPKAAGAMTEMTVVHGFVSTHSRPKAAGFSPVSSRKNCGVSTHSRPKAAGGRTSQSVLVPKVSTHSRPKAAGFLP